MREYHGNSLIFLESFLFLSWANLTDWMNWFVLIIWTYRWKAATFIEIDETGKRSFTFNKDHVKESRGKQWLALCAKPGGGGEQGLEMNNLTFFTFWVSWTHHVKCVSFGDADTVGVLLFFEFEDTNSFGNAHRWSKISSDCRRLQACLASWPDPRANADVSFPRTLVFLSVSFSRSWTRLC